jgi:YHS domain-containing protein
MQTLIYFLVWGAVFLVLMRLGCGAHIMGHGHFHSASDNPPKKDTDPVCGMTIETAKAKSSVYQGHIYYFCSQDCREKFEAWPRGYVNGSARPVLNMEASHEHRH